MKIFKIPFNCWINDTHMVALRIVGEKNRRLATCY